MERITECERKYSQIGKEALGSFGSLPFRDNQAVAIKNYHCKIQHKKELRMVFQKR